MILRRYSQKNEKIAPQYKKYLQSCAELIRPENPPKFEFVDSTVELELVQGTKNEEKENEEYYFVGTADCKVAEALGLQRCDKYYYEGKFPKQDVEIIEEKEKIEL